jgi:hypothetical protein
MALPIGLVASPAGAAAGASCKSLTGTAKLAPGLPITTSKVKVKPTYTIKGAKLTGCTGGVTSGVLAATLKQALPGNCTTLLAGGTANISGTATVVWNNKTTSTFTVKLVGQKNVSQFKIPGKVTKGAFLKSTTSGTVAFTPAAGSCTKKPLSAATFKSTTKIVI